MKKKSISSLILGLLRKNWLALLTLHVGITVWLIGLWPLCSAQLLKQMQYTTGSLEDRFGVPLAVRKKVFSDFALKEAPARTRARRRFPNHPWSQDDDRSWVEHRTARSLEKKYKLNIAQIYLILDEGIREHWPGIDGHPISATVVPLNPRTR